MDDRRRRISAASSTRGSPGGPAWTAAILAQLVICSAGWLAVGASQQVIVSTGFTWVNLSSDSAPLTYTGPRRDRLQLALMDTYKRQQSWLEEARVLAEPSGANFTYWESPTHRANQVSEDDLILETLDRLYLTRGFHPAMHAWTQPEQRAQAADRRQVNETTCSRHLDYLLHQLELLRLAHERGAQAVGLSADLAGMLDAFGQEQSGLLEGNYAWLGDWRSCKRRLVLDRQRQVAFRARYCLASLRAPSWPAKLRSKARRLADEQYFRWPNQEETYQQFHRIPVGICLPESCDSTLLERRRADLGRLAKFKLRAPFSGYQLADLYCLPDGASELRQLSASAWALLALAGAWTAALAAASAADRLGWVSTRCPAGGAKGRGWLEKLVVSLSLRESWRSFERVGSPGGALVFLDALRAIGVVPILAAHVYMCALWMTSNPLDELKLPVWLLHQTASFVLAVDWFLCVSGFLVAHNAFAKRLPERNEFHHWLYSVFHRYWRLAPGYLLLFWFARSLFTHLGEGPLWDYATSPRGKQAVCARESWLTPLTLTPNWHLLTDECILPAWYIGCDLQLYLLSPPLLVLLQRRPRLAWLLAAVAALASALLTGHAHLTEPLVRPAALLRLRSDYLWHNTWHIPHAYLQPQFRAAAYLLGVLAGHYAHQVRAGHWQSRLWARTKARAPSARAHRRLLVCAALWLQLSAQTGSLTLDLMAPAWLEAHARPLVAVAYAVVHPLAGLACALLLVALALGAAPAWLRWPLWTRLARTNYWLYLGQMELLVWLHTSLDRLPSSSGLEGLKVLLASLALAYPLSLAATLLVSNPLSRLELELLGVHLRAPVEGRPDRRQLRPEEVGAAGGGHC